MNEEWRKGYLTGLYNEGWRSEVKIGSFIATSAEPYRQHRTTGMKFYLALEEARIDRYTKQPFHRVWSVGVALDGSQSGECSAYSSLADSEGFPPIVERFEQLHQFAISNCKKLYRRYEELRGEHNLQEINKCY